MLHKVQGHLGRLIHWKNKEKPTVCRQTDSQPDRRTEADGGLTTDVHSCSQRSDGVFKWASTGMQTEQGERWSPGLSQGRTRTRAENVALKLSLHSSSFSFVHRAGQRSSFWSLNPVGKSRLSHVEEMCGKCVFCTAACQWRALNLRQRSCQQTIQSSFCGLDEFTQVDVIKVRNLTENRRTLTTLFHHYIIIIQRSIWWLQTVKV